MQAAQFEEAVDTIWRKDPRFEPGAYFFLKDALDFTVKRIAEQSDGSHRHISGPELLVGFRDFALQEFGPMAGTLLTEWGVRRCEDVGTMVFHLIDEQVFGKQDSDSLEDFATIFDFDDVFVLPYLPKRATHRLAAN